MCDVYTCVSLLIFPNYQGLLDHTPSVQKVPQLLLVNLYVGESDPVPSRQRGRAGTYQLKQLFQCSENEISILNQTLGLLMSIIPQK